MTSEGSPSARFQRALKTRNLLIIRSAAAELSFIRLADALAICMILRDAEPERFEAAAVRWIGRFCIEQPGVTLAEIEAAVTAFEDLRREPESARERLQALCGYRDAR